LGQGTALGNLAYRPGLCGQVVSITCTGGPAAFPAVIVSTCNLGSTSCGIDMIGRTWSKATGGASPGETSCEVSLSKKNPLTVSGPVCFHRTGSSTDEYSRILGIMNTEGEISASATLAGKTGTRFNGNWFEFNAGGSKLFVPSAEVVFTYESGNTAKFMLSECKDLGPVKIFS
jgi:hypothetical protein